MKKTVSLILLTAMTLTAGSAKAQSVFYEGFANDSLDTGIPDGWTVYGDTLQNHVAYSQYNQSWQVWYPDGQCRNGEAMSVTLTAEGTVEPCDRWLVTPRIALPADSAMSLLFNHHCVVFSQFHVLLSTTGTDKADFTDTLGLVTLQPQWQTAHFPLDVYAGDSVYVAFVNDVIHGNGHCSQYMVIDDVEVKHLPENDIKLVDVTFPEHISVDHPITATLHVTNTGRNHVGSLAYSYSIDGSERVENTVSVNLWPYWTVEVNVTFVPTKLGEWTIDAEVGRPNGAADYDSSDNRLVRSFTVTEGNLGIAATEGPAWMTAYPNPCRDRVTVRLGDGATGRERAWLTDVMGRREEVRLDAEADGGCSLDLDGRPQGTYLLTIVAPTGQMNTIRLVKRF